MLKLTIQGEELFDEKTSEFITTKDQTLQLEHSLVSLSKWEARWCKPFLTAGEKSEDEVMDYIRCMTITQNVDDSIYESITEQQGLIISEYIDADMTATTFSNIGSEKNREVITSELIYYWMISLNIPFECQKWHLNRLLTLINVCNLKNAPPKKMGKQDVAKRNAELNAARKRELGTEG